MKKKIHDLTERTAVPWTEKVRVRPCRRDARREAASASDNVTDAIRPLWPSQTSQWMSCTRDTNRNDCIVGAPLSSQAVGTSWNVCHLRGVPRGVRPPKPRREVEGQCWHEKGHEGWGGALVLVAHICLGFDLCLQAELSPLVTQGEPRIGAGTRYQICTHTLTDPLHPPNWSSLDDFKSN